MSDKFRLLMNSLDDDLLEEAMTPVKKRRILPWIGAAACLLLAVGMSMYSNHSPADKQSQMLDQSYVKLPEEAIQICCDITTQTDCETGHASFVVHDTTYVYETVKTPEPQKLTDSSMEGTQLLTWNTGDLDIQLISSSTSTSVSWYLEDTQTQCYLTADADTLKVLTSASQILRATGLDVTVAPNRAENITYNAFLLDGLTVAETTFQIDGITYAYRMAATSELLENFKDISGLTDPFNQVKTGAVRWCRAKLSLSEGDQGKIIWFDVVPGILYSLSMDSGASESALLDMANQLFQPAQENS